MQAASIGLEAALSTDEVCPLCLDRYAAVDECTCVVCEAPSCPGCADAVDTDGAMRCFACRPALVGPAPMQVAARAPMILPSPVRFPTVLPAPPAGASAELPTLPFPLSSSPQRVRKITPLPMGALVLAPLPPLAGQVAPRAQSQDDEPAEEVCEADLVVVSPWRLRPLLALARAADKAKLNEVSSLLMGWAYAGSRRFSLEMRMRRLSLKDRLKLRSDVLRTQGARLSRQLVTAMEPRARALGSALKLRAVTLIAVAATLSKRVSTQALRASLTQAQRVSAQAKHVSARALRVSLTHAQSFSKHARRASLRAMNVSLLQAKHASRHAKRLSSQVSVLSSRLLSRSKPTAAERPSSVSL